MREVLFLPFLRLGHKNQGIVAASEGVAVKPCAFSLASHATHPHTYDQEKELKSNF